MRLDLLKAAVAEFKGIYPMGFQDPEMLEISKKHKALKMQEMAHNMFDKDKFGFPNEIIEDMIKIISRSSLVSIFEKPKFRDYVRSLSPETKEALSHSLYERLYNDKEAGFNTMVQILVQGKIAKWPVISVIPYYLYPQEEAFIKPTTVKNIIRVFELEGIIYKPRPSYDFYLEYRRQLLEMRKHVDPDLAPDNAAFSGFLMMAMDLMN